MIRRICAGLYFIDILAHCDRDYMQMRQECKNLEQEFEDIMNALPDEKADLVWKFLFRCEDMSIRKLQLACDCLVFPETPSGKDL